MNRRSLLLGLLATPLVVPASRSGLLMPVKPLPVAAPAACIPALPPGFDQNAMVAMFAGDDLLVRMPWRDFWDEKKRGRPLAQWIEDYPRNEHGMRGPCRVRRVRIYVA